LNGHKSLVAEAWTPPLRVRETAGRCRLCLGAWAYGDGYTLQEAADDLLVRVLRQARHLFTGGVAIPAELGPPDHQWFEFLWELAEMTARGEDVRARVLS
jgi:hypothetical protein